MRLEFENEQFMVNLINSVPELPSRKMESDHRKPFSVVIFLDFEKLVYNSCSQTSVHCVSIYCAPLFSGGQSFPQNIVF